MRIMVWLVYRLVRKPVGFAWFCPLAVLPMNYAFDPVGHEMGVEWVDGDDISLLQASWRGDSERGGWQSSLSLAYGRYSMDYEPVPFDFNGENKHLSETNLALQLNGRKQVRDHFWLMVGAGIYDGFTNYRSIWLDEYYRQQFSGLVDFPGADNYVEADPKGINATAGSRWEYKPGTGFAEINVSWLNDDVSPGYEIDFDGLRRGALRLTTGAVSMSTENVLTKRMRSFAEIRASETTARSTRYGADVTLHVALGQNWVSRWNIGGAMEDPRFDAFYGRWAFEYQVKDNFTWFVDARYYEDTGEIENALLFTSAAPGLISKRLGVGLRWMGNTWSARVYFAPLATDYEPTKENTDFFQNLYRDRDWNVFQIAVRRTL